MSECSRCSELEKALLAAEGALNAIKPGLEELSKEKCRGRWDACGKADDMAKRADDLLDIVKAALSGGDGPWTEQAIRLGAESERRATEIEAGLRDREEERKARKAAQLAQRGA